MPLIAAILAVLAILIGALPAEAAPVETAGALDASVDVTVTPDDLPPGMTVEVVYWWVPPVWPSAWLCAVETEHADGYGFTAACADAEQIEADYPPPYWPAPYTDPAFPAGLDPAEQVAP